MTSYQTAMTSACAALVGHSAAVLLGVDECFEQPILFEDDDLPSVTSSHKIG